MPADSGHSTSVTAVWEGGWRCRVSAAGFDLIVDEPEEAGGTGTGPMPTEYLLAAMASCYALALTWSAGKRGMALPDLAVKATGVYDGPRFGALQFQVTTSAPADLVGALIEPALRVCYVSNTIMSSPPIEVVIAGAGATPRAGQAPEAGDVPEAGQAPKAGDTSEAGQAPKAGDTSEAGQAAVEVGEAPAAWGDQDPPA